jgi:hypothetical protein
MYLPNHLSPAKIFYFWSIWLLLISVFGKIVSLNYLLMKGLIILWKSRSPPPPRHLVFFFSFQVSKGLFSTLIAPLLSSVIDEANIITLVHLDTSSFKRKESITWSRIRIWVHPTCSDLYCKQENILEFHWNAIVTKKISYTRERIFEDDTCFLYCNILYVFFLVSFILYFF